MYSLLGTSAILIFVMKLCSDQILTDRHPWVLLSIGTAVAVLSALQAFVLFFLDATSNLVNPVETLQHKSERTMALDMERLKDADGRG
jgi:hypothetical protein